MEDLSHDEYRDSTMTKITCVITIMKQTFPNSRSYHMQNECNELLDHDKRSHLNPKSRRNIS